MRRTALTSGVMTRDTAVFSFYSIFLYHVRFESSSNQLCSFLQVTGNFCTLWACVVVVESKLMVTFWPGHRFLQTFYALYHTSLHLIFSLLGRHSRRLENNDDLHPVWLSNSSFLGICTKRRHTRRIFLSHPLSFTLSFKSASISLQVIDGAEC